MYHILMTFFWEVLYDPQYDSNEKRSIEHWCPNWACFSKVPKLFGRISGDMILFVSSKRRRLEARNFAIIFTFTPFTIYEKISFTE